MSQFGVKYTHPDDFLKFESYVFPLPPPARARARRTLEKIVIESLAFLSCHQFEKSFPTQCWTTQDSAEGLPQKLSSIFASEAFVVGKYPNLPDKEITGSEPVRTVKIGRGQNSHRAYPRGKHLKERKGSHSREDDRTRKNVCKKIRCASFDISTGISSGAAVSDGGRKAPHDANKGPSSNMFHCNKYC